jgi:hypothetical protein
VFETADVGITGANFAVAETGSIVLVTNEGNGRLVSALTEDARRHPRHGTARADNARPRRPPAAPGP